MCTTTTVIHSLMNCTICKKNYFEVLKKLSVPIANGTSHCGVKENFDEFSFPFIEI